MKKIPKGNKGLAKLPKAVRNKMGYMKNGGSTSEDQKYTKLNYRKDGSVKKYKEISKKSFDRKSKRYSNQEGSNTVGTSSSKLQQVISGRNPNKSVSRRPASMMNGGEKLLNKMTYGGASMDMSDPMVKRMRMGGNTPNTYSGNPTTKKAGTRGSKPMTTRQRQEKEAKAKGMTY